MSGGPYGGLPVTGPAAIITIGGVGFGLPWVILAIGTVLIVGGFFFMRRARPATAAATPGRGAGRRGIRQLFQRGRHHQ